MVVTEIVSRNKSKVNIKIDGEIAFVLYKGDLAKLGIEEGTELSEETYREITEEILPKRALDRSYNLLLSRDYTEKLFREKLTGDGYPDSVINQTTEELRKQKYLDDRRYAENYIFWKAKSKSKNRLIMDLTAKGVSKELSEELYRKLLEQNDIDPEEVQIRCFLEKKHFNPAECSFEEKEKMKQSLYRKGFSFDSILKALGRGEFD